MDDVKLDAKNFDALPHGLCASCLAAMVDPERGRAAFFGDLGLGRGLWGMYCEHNEAGAFSFSGPGHATKWTVNTPIEVDEFLALMDKTVAYYLEALPTGPAS